MFFHPFLFNVCVLTLTKFSEWTFSLKTSKSWQELNPGPLSKTRYCCLSDHSHCHFKFVKPNQSANRGKSLFLHFPHKLFPAASPDKLSHPWDILCRALLQPMRVCVGQSLSLSRMNHDTSSETGSELSILDVPRHGG